MHVHLPVHQVVLFLFIKLSWKVYATWSMFMTGMVQQSNYCVCSTPAFTSGYRFLTLPPHDIQHIADVM